MASIFPCICPDSSAFPLDLHVRRFSGPADVHSNDPNLGVHASQSEWEPDPDPDPDADPEERWLSEVGLKRHWEWGSRTCP